MNQLCRSNKLPWIIIGIGGILRFLRYLHNPSLWFDEADIVIDLISRPFSDIINPSADYTQAYPYAFLMLVKLFTALLGNSEYVIRLFPLLAGTIALLLFHRVAKHYITHNAMLIALGLFALSDLLIIESSNLKPYSSDVMLTLLILVLAIDIQLKGMSAMRVIIFAVTGAIVVWFSSPSMFVLAGVGLCLGIIKARKKDWSAVTKLLVAASIWISSFAINYIFYLHNLKANFGLNMEGMLVREKALMPIPPFSVADIKWFMDLFFDVFNNPLGMTLTGLSALAFIVGLSTMFIRQRSIFFMITSPIILAFLAAAAHLYPFRGRFIFFLLPLILLLVAEGAEYIRARTVQNGKIVGITFLLLLFLHPLMTSAYRIIKPFYWEDIKPVIHYVKNNWQQDDVLYVHYFTQYTFEYYTKYYPEPYAFNEDDYIIGIAPRRWYNHWRKTEVGKYYGPGEPVNQSFEDIFKIYIEDLNKLKGKKRVWIIFTESISKDRIDEEKFFVHHLKTIGTQLELFGQPGVSVAYLFDLSRDMPVTD